MSLWSVNASEVVYCVVTDQLEGFFSELAILSMLFVRTTNESTVSSSR